jgi:hypothetical protein
VAPGFHENREGQMSRVYEIRRHPLAQGVNAPALLLVNSLAGVFGALGEWTN